MTDYSGYGNEKLLPLAVDGNTDAERELNDRGSTVTAEGRLQKIYYTTRRNYQGDNLISEDFIERTVVNGKLVKVTVNGLETASVVDV